MPVAGITIGNLISTTMSAGIGATIASLATIVTFSNRMVLLEEKTLNRSDIKLIIDETTPWLRDKQLVVEKLDVLEVQQSSTEIKVDYLSIQQSRIEVELENVGNDVKSILDVLGGG